MTFMYQNLSLDTFGQVTPYPKGRGTVQKAVLLVALARAAGIPAGLGFARIRNNLLLEKMLK